MWTYYLALLTLLFGATPYLATAKARVETTDTISIMADVSLSVPLTLLTRQYAQSRNISITTVYGTTPQQILDIETGKAANILIASRNAWIEGMARKGLINIYSRRVIARNKMVIAGSYYNTSIIDINNVDTIDDFTNTPDHFAFAIPNPSFNAEGGYAIESINANKLGMALEPYYNFFSNMYELIMMINNNQTMGMIYHTDALLFPDIKIMHVFNKEDHSPITYQAVSVVGSNMEHALAFIDYLATEDAQSIFRAYGFDSPSQLN